MSKLDKEIYELIAKNLPAQTAGALKEELEKLESYKRRAEVAERERDGYSENLTKALAENSALKNRREEVERRERLVAKEEAELAERKRNQKVFEAETKANAANASLNNILDLYGSGVLLGFVIWGMK